MLHLKFAKVINLLNTEIYLHYKWSRFLPHRERSPFHI